MNLDENNILIYSIKAYEKPEYALIEFYEDERRFKSLNRLFLNYHVNRVLKERVILNHLIILRNVFSNSTVNLLFYHIKKEYYPYLKTFLLYLQIMKDKIEGIRGETIISSNIPVNMEIVKILRELK